MTTLLEQAFHRASELSEAEQDMLAQELLSELDGEAQWDPTLASSASHRLLERLAEKARNDIDAGRVTEGGFDAP